MSSATENQNNEDYKECICILRVHFEKLHSRMTCRLGYQLRHHHDMVEPPRQTQAGLLCVAIQHFHITLVYHVSISLGFTTSESVGQGYALQRPPGREVR